MSELALENSKISWYLITASTQDSIDYIHDSMDVLGVLNKCVVQYENCIILLVRFWFCFHVSIPSY